MATTKVDLIWQSSCEAYKVYGPDELGNMTTIGAGHSMVCQMARHILELEQELSRLRSERDDSAQVIKDYADQIRELRAEREQMLERYGKPLAWAVMTQSGEYDYTLHGEEHDAKSQAEHSCEEGDELPPVLPLYSIGDILSTTPQPPVKEQL